MLPVVGIIDSKRAQDIMNAMLHKIMETQSKAFILDISGVAVVDTAVANHLIKITKASRLMGCLCTISGVSPAVSQTIVELGIHTEEINTTGNMKDALSQAFKLTGVSIHKNKKKK
jgi:rsbT co-antagonist protein RsbR